LEHLLGFEGNVRKNEGIGMEGTIRRMEGGEEFRGEIKFIGRIGHEEGLLGSGIEHCQMGRTGHRPIDAASSRFISLGFVTGSPLIVLDGILSQPQSKVTAEMIRSRSAYREENSLTGFPVPVRHKVAIPA
jgi:hypothetical protein